jgi:sortase A
MGYLYLKKNHVQKKSYPRLKKTFAAVFFIAGLLLFASAVIPILQFQVEYSSKFGQIINPLSTQFYNQSGNVLGDNTPTDYTQLSNWFITDNHTDPVGNSLLTNNPITSYKISIPALKIQDAVVDVGSVDLKKSLIQYPQTALPGQLGNSVIFGHSVLPQFFNSKSYLTIFATLYRLKSGDEIYIDYDNIHYKYIVEELFEVAPTDLSVLEQRFDGRYLSLITCSPPGTVLRRLIVKAQIADI